MLEFLASLRTMPPGDAVAAVHKKVQVKRWQRCAEVTVRCAGRTARLRTRPASTDAEVIWQCFPSAQYEVPKPLGIWTLHADSVQAMYNAVRGAGRTPLIVDCGANMGASSVWFDLRYPGSKILAIEPAAANVEFLRANGAGRASIEVIEAGIGPQDGSAFLSDSGGGHWGYQTTDTPRDGVTEVPIRSLSSLIAQYCTQDDVPFILKIDIEGAEKDLFNQDRSTIERFPLVIFEPHDFYIPGERTASPFWKFHGETGRDFLFFYENVFSLDMTALRRTNL